MRETALSNLERDFVIKAISEGRRCDGRPFDEYRDLKISFGDDSGCCCVDLGQTKVMCQVSAEIEKPKESRASEGNVTIHIELPTLADAKFDPAKPGELGIELQRMLEKSIIMSQSLDVEELCLRVGERSWGIHIYLHVLCNDGNILDCASIAAITSLKHFRRPAVSVDGEDVIIYSEQEKNPLPLTVHHMPLCTTFSFFKECKSLVLDPTGREEKVLDGKLMICMNKHNEICCLQMSGQMFISKEQILVNTSVSYEKVQDFSKFILYAIEENCKSKSTRKNFIFSDWKRNQIYPQMESSNQKLTINQQKPLVVEQNTEVEPKVTAKTEPSWLSSLESQVVNVGEGAVNSWDQKSSMFEVLKKDPSASDEHSDSDSDSEDEAVTLNQNDVGIF